MGTLRLPINVLWGYLILKLLSISKFQHISHDKKGTILGLLILDFNSTLIYTHIGQRCISLLSQDVNIHISFMFEEEGHSLPIKTHASSPHHMYNSVQVACRNNQVNLSRHTSNTI